MSIKFGAIADDFSGATDLCNTLVKEGVRVVQIIGIPDASTDVGEADAVVVALKSRTAPVREAVEQSLAAYDWLVDMGAQQVIEKYCSTFDSTTDGNIGPITDALMERSGAELTIVCPASPENGRTIYNGHLFVGSQLLSDSSMKDHPLTPMRDSSLTRLMERQGCGKAGIVPLQTIRSGSDSIRSALSQLADMGVQYAITDAIDSADLRAIGSASDGLKFVTGGSGIAMGLPANFRMRGQLGAPDVPPPPEIDARKVVLAGSCSKATRGQIQVAQKNWPTKRVSVDQIAAGEDIVSELLSWARSQPVDKPVIIYSSSDPEEVAASQAKYGGRIAGEMIEHAMAQLAIRLTNAGFGQIIVAGGETSGAVVSALKIKSLRIGPEISPGVPWTETTEDKPIALALKSGNFGGENFFESAFEMLR